MNQDKDLNLDPLTGAPGAHPVGTGVGAAGGAVTGAAVGSIGGPVGTAVGAVVGAVVGGLAGKSVAEVIDPTAEEAYWRDNYTAEPYYNREYAYADYAPAYGLGVRSLLTERYRDRPFEDVEGELERDWNEYRGASRLSWAEASPAARAAWARAGRDRGAV